MTADFARLIPSPAEISSDTTQPARHGSKRNAASGVAPVERKLKKE